MDVYFEETGSDGDFQWQCCQDKHVLVDGQELEACALIFNDAMGCSLKLRTKSGFVPIGCFYLPHRHLLTKYSFFSVSLTSRINEPISAFAAIESQFFKSMIHAINSMSEIFSRHSMRRYLLKRHTKIHNRARELITSSATSSSLTGDAWSSRVYMWYMEMSIHWTDNNWDMHSSLLDFVRFKTLSTEEAACNVLIKAFSDCELEKCFYSEGKEQSWQSNGIEHLR